MSLKLEQLISSLNSRYMCREPQIRQLSECLKKLCQTVIVYGLRSTAKTSLVKSLLKESNSFFAYINCNEFFTNKMVYENILIQLNKRIKCFELNEIKCNSLSDFIDYFHQILVNYNKIKEKISKSNAFSQCIIVLDSIDSNHSLMNANNTELITSLTDLEEYSQNVCPITSIFISCQSVEWFSRMTCRPIPITQINFTNYSSEELLLILSSESPNGFEPNFYKNYVHIIIKSMIQLTRDLKNIRSVCLTNFSKYIEPIKTEEINGNESAKLYKRFQPILVRIIEEFPLKVIRISKESMEWSQSMKYLIIASYLSSYNSTKNDKKLFVRNEGKRKERKRKTVIEDNERVGPKGATFERIFHIYKSIVELNARNSDHFLEESSNELFSQFQELVFLKYINRSVSQKKSHCLSTQTKYEISSSVTLDFIKDMSLKLDLNIMAFLQL